MFYQHVTSLIRFVARATRLEMQSKLQLCVFHDSSKKEKNQTERHKVPSNLSMEKSSIQLENIAGVECLSSHSTSNA